MTPVDTVSIDRATRTGVGFALSSDHLMPLDSDAQLFCALAPEGTDTVDVDIMNQRFAGRGKNAVWLSMRPDATDFASTVATLKLFGNCVGLSVHAPYQAAIVEHLDSLSPRGRVAGMADVARRTSDNCWEGDLAALDAFRRTLRSEGIRPKGARAWLIGAEGDAVPAALSLAEHGVSTLTVFDAEVSAAVALAYRVRAAFPRVTVSVGIPDARSIDLVVDGQASAAIGSPGPDIEPSWLSADTLVVEAVPRRAPGPFASRCLKAGLTVVAGDSMLVHQLNAYDEFFGWSRIPYKAGSLQNLFMDAA